MEIIERLQEQRQAKIDFVDALVAETTQDKRDLSETEKRNLEATQERIKEIDAQLEPLVQFEALRAQAAPITRAAKSAPKPVTAESEDLAGIVQRSWEGWSYQGTSPRVDLPMQFRVLPHTTAAFGLDSGAPLNVVGQPDVRTPLLDTLNSISVTGTVASYVTYTVTDGTDVVAEAGVKPNLEIVPTPVNTVIPKIANFSAATRELLEDAASVRSLLEGEMRRGVARKLESEAGAAIAAGTYGTTVNADMLAAIRVAKGEVDDRGYGANVLLINPADLAALDIGVMNNAGLNAVTQNTYFGLQVVSSSAVAAGTTYVADAASAWTHFSREGVQVFATDSHGDNFASNILNFVAEARALTAVIRPDAVQETAAA